jgi:dipeptidyl aminopeptidase/acylaminoacyl peptidase
MRRLRLLGLFISALMVALVMLPVGIGAVLMWQLTHSGCSHGPTPDLPYENVTFDAPEDRSLPGYFFPGDNGATVIVVPTLTNDRGGDLADAAIFNRAGFNVLTYDSRSCQGSAVTSLGYLEAADAEAAFHYLSTRPDVDASRISIHGFSAGGATSLFTAARVPQIRAVSAKGGYHDFAEQLGIRQYDGVLTALFRFGAEAAYRIATGENVEVLSPLSVITNINPRPILLIYGDREVSLPGARAMRDAANAAGGHADLWIVEGAGHGNYLQIAGERYERKLVDFHRAATNP